MADAAPSHAPSNAHADLMARDAARVYGWRYQPAIQFERGEGIWLYDVDGKRYYDLTAGMMCNVLGHCHPELVEVMRAEAGKLWHENSWYSNPHLVRFAERIASTLPEGLEVVNFAVTGSEANEVAMRMALAVSGKHDILSVIRGLHGGSLAVESVTTIGGAIWARCWRPPMRPRSTRPSATAARSTSNTRPATWPASRNRAS